MKAHTILGFTVIDHFLKRMEARAFPEELVLYCLQKGRTKQGDDDLAHCLDRKYLDMAIRDGELDPWYLKGVSKAVVITSGNRLITCFKEFSQA